MDAQNVTIVPDWDPTDPGLASDWVWLILAGMMETDWWRALEERCCNAAWNVIYKKMVVNMIATVIHRGRDATQLPLKSTEAACIPGTLWT
jgi:hypothetical protein